MPWKPVDIIGKRFGRLVVLAYIQASFWHCRCDCGRDTVVETSKLNSGHTRSCGCLHTDRMQARATHGHTVGGKRSATHVLWMNMIQRCTNPGAVGYANYGGRGIGVCERWRDFSSFLADMGERPPGLTLDRVDTNGNYEPDNCRWLDMKGQQNNRRNNHLITLGGETLGITEWSRRTGIYRHTIRRRLERGWSIEDALTP